MRTALLNLLCAAAFSPEPQFVPLPQFVPIPKFVETPTAEASKEGGQAVYPIAPRADEPAPVKDASRILRWERQCVNGVCRNVPIYEESVDQAAAKLQGWRDLPESETRRLAAIVDGPEIKKARAGHWDAGTCAMLCTIPSHGTHWIWDDPVDDGTPEPAWGSWESGTNQIRGRVRILPRRR